MENNEFSVCYSYVEYVFLYSERSLAPRSPFKWDAERPGLRSHAERGNERCSTRFELQKVLVGKQRRGAAGVQEDDRAFVETPATDAV